MIWTCDGVKYWSEVAAQVTTAAAIVGGAWWFLYTTQFKPRIQFDVDCRFLTLQVGQNSYLAEVSLIFENKGFVEHRLYDLSLSIHGLSSERLASTIEPSTKIFDRTLFPRQIIVPSRYKWYFVRPGVKQTVTYQVALSGTRPDNPSDSGIQLYEASGLAAYNAAGVSR
ncbi:MAG: hypothetical protein WAM71_09485 [Candidatus Korobacteraceae bacterium]